MSAGFPYFHSASEEIHSLKKSWILFLLLGILFLLFGTVSIAYPMYSTKGLVQVFGVLLLFAAGGQIASTFWARRWGGFVLHLLLGLLYLFVGVMMLERPLRSAMELTLLMAVFFFAGGIIRIVFALTEQFTGWGWTLMSGVIAVMLGMMIWQDFPESSFWVIGTFVGIDFLFVGWSWVMMGMALKGLPEKAAG